MEYVETGPMYKKFAWWPVKTISGKRLWLRRVWAQGYCIKWGPQYFLWTHYYTDEDAITKRLSDD